MENVGILGSPKQPSGSYQERQEKKRHRTEVWCCACEMFHAIPRPTREWSKPDPAESEDQEK